MEAMWLQMSEGGRLVRSEVREIVVGSGRERCGSREYSHAGT